LLEQYRELVLNFFKDPSQGITQWAWNFGLGSDAFQVYSYYNIGDIFTYIALLFPKSQLALAFQLTIILRLYCA
ncbi:YfhO family protein, partial [Intestinimonas butyriciproducens]